MIMTILSLPYLELHVLTNTVLSNSAVTSCSCSLQQTSSADTNVSHVTCGFVGDTKEQDTKLTTPAIVLTTPDEVGVHVLAMSHLQQCEQP